MGSLGIAKGMQTWAGLTFAFGTLAAGCMRNTVVRSFDNRRPNISGADNDAPGKRTTDELLGPESGLFCPTGFQFSTRSRLCVNDREAVGPFPPEMVSLCKQKRVDAKTCEGDRWPVSLARELRGEASCPPGTTLDRTLGACAQGSEVFGPFRTDLVSFCKINGGGSGPCEGMRWHRDILAIRNLPPVPTVSGPSPDFSASAHFDEFPNPAEGARNGQLRLWATFYMLAQASHVDDGIPLRNLNGESLGTAVSRADWCDAAMEGSVRMRNGPLAGKTFNYAGTSSAHAVDCSAYFDHASSGRVKFRVARGEYGDGVLDYVLVPLRSVAVDPATIPYGSVIFIPAARGVEVDFQGQKLKHDGYFFAADAGGLIKGNHIDVYAGPTTTSPFSFIKSTASGTFEAYVINDPNIIRAMRARHLK